MKPKNDAYGQGLWAHLKGKESFEIVERDDGYFGVPGGPIQHFADHKHWSIQEKRAMRFVKGMVLDIGCGAGKHSLYLQKKGYDITGIDNSPLAIRVCKERGLKGTKVMSITEIGRFKPNQFDTILMLGSNFGLFGSLRKAKALLKKLNRITSNRATIITESFDIYKTDNPVHIEYHKSNKKRGRMSGQIRIRIRFEKCVGEWFDYLLVSKEEMKYILKGTGWGIKEFLDSKKTSYVAVIEKI